MTLFKLKEHSLINGGSPEEKNWTFCQQFNINLHALTSILHISVFNLTRVLDMSLSVTNIDNRNLIWGTIEVVDLGQESTLAPHSTWSKVSA